MKGFLQDLRYASSNFLRSPMFALLAVLSLALGIGANAAIFSLIHTVLLRPLPYPEPDRLVRLWETFVYSSGQGTGSVSPPNLIDWREQSDSFQAMAAYSMSSFNLTGGDTPVLIRGARLEPHMWPLLGVQPRHGRVFQEGENSEGQDQVVVLSHGLWQRRYSGDPGMVGEEIDIDGAPHTVIGIMPESFQCPPRSNAELWTPLTYTQSQLDSRGSHWLAVLGRLKAGVPLERAQAEMDAIGDRIEEAYPGPQTDRGIHIRPLHDSLVWRTEDALWTLWAAVGFVLLIACANVANLLLARSVSRRRELAVRAAMGAGRGRIVRQMLTESLLLALAGGAVGLAVGYATVRYLASLPGTSIPQGQPIQLDPWVLAFCLGASFLTAVVAGIFPALRCARVDIADALKDRGSSEGLSGGRDWLRAGLVVAEVALAVVVLIGAGLLLKSYSKLIEVDPGIDTQRLLTLSIPLSGEKYQDSAQMTSFYRRLQERVEGLPGVESAGMINLLPLQNWGWNGGIFHDAMDPDTPVSQRPLIEIRTIAGDYFQTMGIPVLAGRVFSFGDSESPREVIVNKAFADRVFDGQSPLGRRIAFSYPDDPANWISIAGMVGNVRNAGLQRDPRPEMYFPFAQVPRSSMSLALRTAVDPLSISDSVRRSVMEIDPGQPVYRVMLMDEVLLSSVADKRFNTLLMGVFAFVALALAIAGVYGVLSYTVGRRTYEIAVRMAMGALHKDVYRLVVSASLATAGLGILAGATASLWLTRYMENQLYGVEATDPATLAAVCAILLLVSLSAALIPARRAARVDPLVALRSE